MLEVELTSQHGRLAIRSARNIIESENITSSISRKPTLTRQLHKAGVALCIVPGEPKKIPPTTFVDITAMHGNFCTKFYTIVKRSNIHFITKLY